MTVKVLLFARYAELAGIQELEIEMEPHRTVGDLWERIRQEIPPLRGVSDSPLMAWNRCYTAATRPLSGAEEVAFFPPVGGG